MGDRRLPFGKFRGKDLSAVPTSYLVWLVEDGVREPYWTSIRAELADRLDLVMAPAAAALVRPPDDLAPAFRELLTVGYKQLAKAAHPDHGGDLERMKAVNAVRDWCRQAGLV